MRTTLVVAVFGFMATLAYGTPRSACAQDAAPVTSATDPGGITITLPDPLAIKLEDVLSDNPDSLLRHSYLNDRFWFSAQVNLILQGHPGFIAPYSGPNSFVHEREQRLSEVATLSFGVRVLSYTEILCDAEQIGGAGISNAFGLAGYVNMDVVRNPAFGEEPYLARIMLHQMIPLTDDMVPNPNQGPFSMRSQVPSHRLEFYAGKFGLSDFFDQCCCGDGHMELMNWGAVTNLAWDYGADTRGYDWGIMAEYVGPIFAVRFVEALEPTVSNGINLDWNIQRTHCENAEVEIHGNTFGDRRGKLSVLGYFNQCHMGSYEDSLRYFFEGNGDMPVPDILQSERLRNRTRNKYGVCLEAEQEITETVRVFGRLGWNDDKNEDYAYSECGNTAQLGFDIRGDLWDRERDRFAVMFQSSGLGSAHRRYLEYGGIGTLCLGDGGLSYQRETIIETCYTVKLPYGISFGPDYQRIWNPGFNHARGPADVFAFRFHLEI